MRRKMGQLHRSRINLLLRGARTNFTAWPPCEAELRPGGFVEKLRSKVDEGLHRLGLVILVPSFVVGIVGLFTLAYTATRLNPTLEVARQDHSARSWHDCTLVNQPRDYGKSFIDAPKPPCTDAHVLNFITTDRRREFDNAVSLTAWPPLIAWVLYLLLRAIGWVVNGFTGHRP
jgi:hypothetical protein